MKYLLGLGLVAALGCSEKKEYDVTLPQNTVQQRAPASLQKCNYSHATLSQVGSGSFDNKNVDVVGYVTYADAELSINENGTWSSITVAIADQKDTIYANAIRWESHPSHNFGPNELLEARLQIKRQNAEKIGIKGHAQKGDLLIHSIYSAEKQLFRNPVKYCIDEV